MDSEIFHAKAHHTGGLHMILTALRFSVVMPYRQKKKEA